MLKKRGHPVTTTVSNLFLVVILFHFFGHGKVMVCYDVILSHPNKDYLLTYSLTYMTEGIHC